MEIFDHLLIAGAGGMICPIPSRLQESDLSVLDCKEGRTSLDAIHFDRNGMRPQCYESGKILKISNGKIVMFVVGKCKRQETMSLG